MTSRGRTRREKASNAGLPAAGVPVVAATSRTERSQYVGITHLWKGQRVDPGTPLIPLSDEKGGDDWGCAYAAACPAVLEDQIRIYYGASNGTHNGWRDGFAGRKPEDKEKPATIV
jgi:hypothetical protein